MITDLCNACCSFFATDGFVQQADGFHVNQKTPPVIDDVSNLFERVFESLAGGMWNVESQECSFNIQEGRL